MKIWVDDIRTPPKDYVWLRSVNQTIDFIKREGKNVSALDIDHDAGDYFKDGGDYIRILDWLEYNHISIPIHIHSMNPVGVNNMKAIIYKNNWKYI